MKLFGIKACDTCRKAIKALEAAGHHVIFHDVRADPLENETLQTFSAAFGPDLMNTRSTTWRGLLDEERAQEPLVLIAKHPTLMKRPVIEADALYLGWGKDVQAKLLT